MGHLETSLSLQEGVRVLLQWQRAGRKVVDSRAGGDLWMSRVCIGHTTVASMWTEHSSGGQCLDLVWGLPPGNE